MPRWVVRDGAVWSVLIGAWLPIAILLGDAQVPSGPSELIFASLGTVALVTTLVYGGLLGRHGRWRELGLASVAGTVALMICYVFAMVAQPDPLNNNDQAAGAGWVILTLPTLLVVASLLGLGGLIGVWSRRGRRWAWTEHRLAS